jgi:hypothetical protein
MTEFTVTVQEGVGGEAVTFFCNERPRYVARYVEGEGFHVKGYHVRDVALRGIEFIPTNGPEWRRGARNFVNIYRVLAVTER